MAVEAVGIDTWSVAWKMGSEDGRWLGENCGDKAGRAMLFEESVAGHRLGYFPHSSLAFVEGHPGSGLASGQQARQTWDRLQDEFRGLGFEVEGMDHWREWSGHVDMTGRVATGVPVLRRVDVTADLRFESPSEGLAVLSGVAGLPVSRCKTETIRQTGGRKIETVYLRAPRSNKVLGRWYDKGNEQGDGVARGTWIRPEDQRRFTSGGGRPELEMACEGRFLRQLFVNRFEELWKASKGITVGSDRRIAEKLAEYQRDKRITAAEAKAVAGHLLLDLADAHMQSESTYYKDKKLARDLGLSLADGVEEEVEVNLQDVIEAALDSEAWGCG